MMKIRLFISFCLVCFVFPAPLFSQTKLIADSPEYERAKQKQGLSYTHKKSSQSNPAESKLSTTPVFFRTCKEMIPVDASFSVVPFDTSSFVHAPFYRNDDKSTQALPLPFNFCFYGHDYDSVFINNNGSISFDIPYGTFVPDSFPNNYYKMISPFWADVDTRNFTSGLVYYKITPTYMVVT